MRIHAQERHRPDRGTVLIVTMWVVLVLAGLVLVFAHGARVEAIAAANRASGLQADAVARGALRYALAAIEDSNGDVGALEETDFDGRRVGDGFFWALRVNLQDESEHYYGLTDEASKINLNSASSDMLLKLPGMTAELADSIVDWRDSNAEVSPNGAESEYYLLLDKPYHCKDAPLETVEEVLLVRGASDELLYGEDTNRNGFLDACENDADQSAPADNRNGSLERGFLDYATVYSSEPNLSSDGQNRVNVNDMNTQDLSELLQEVIEGDRAFAILNNTRNGRPFANLLDYYFRSGLTSEEFSALADRLTTSRQDRLVGLVNVNTAPREVLLCLPELEESDVDALLAMRQDSEADLGSVAWIAEALPREKAVAVGAYVTTHSYQFSADIVAVSGDGRAYRRYRAIIDASTRPPRVLRWQDLTQHGWPLDRETLAELRHTIEAG
ncbi:MAG: general secretion pathway protein GspK [Planctomycetes bacterium]|nr:general secretion pathway protein GspK [Planctomycetota bacterium]